MDHVVVDVEIQKTIEEVPGGWNATDKLGVAVACLWEHTTRRMRIYSKDDVERLRDRLLKADLITGYNILNFDYPVIWGIEKHEWLHHKRTGIREKLLPKTNDLLRRIWLSRGLNPDSFSRDHGGWSLDLVAGETLGAKKIGHGADAPKWYQQGHVLRVANYCADDVALERDLAEFVDKYKYVLRDGGRRHDITAAIGV